MDSCNVNLYLLTTYNSTKNIVGLFSIKKVGDISLSLR